MNSGLSSTCSLGNLLNLPYNPAKAVAAGVTSPYPGFSGLPPRPLRPYSQYSDITDFFLWRKQDNSDYTPFRLISAVPALRRLDVLRRLHLVAVLTESDDPGFNQSVYMKWQNSNFRSEGKSPAGENDTGVGGNFPRYANLNWVWEVPVGDGSVGSVAQVVGSTKRSVNWRVALSEHINRLGPSNNAFQRNDSIPGMSPDPDIGGIWPVYNAGIPSPCSWGPRLRGCSPRNSRANAISEQGGVQRSRPIHLWKYRRPTGPEVRPYFNEVIVVASSSQLRSKMDKFPGDAQ